MAELPVAPVRRIIRNQSNLLVSEDAGKVLRDILDAKGEEVSALAIRFARNAGRKTVFGQDIEEAVRAIL